MIRDPECPYCYGRMVPDMGPRCDPTDDGNVDIEQVERCEVCRWERAQRVERVSDAELERRARIVAEMSGTPDLDARREELAREGYEIGHRWWPRAAS